jgi:hypothetical protein
VGFSDKGCFGGALLSMSLAGALGCVGSSASETIVAGQEVTDAEIDRTVGDPATDPGDGDAAVQCGEGGGWALCGLTDAAELACDSSADCTWQSNVRCCGVPTFGVNKNAPFVGCPAQPCPPPAMYQAACSEYFTQDCRAVDDADSIVVVCIEHRCLTAAAD